MSDKLRRYDAATDLIADWFKKNKMPDGYVARYNLVDFVYTAREAFKEPEIRAKVLIKKYESERFENCHFSAGFCGIMSYMINHMSRMPNGAETLKMKRYSDDIGHFNLSGHMWNFNGKKILDGTFDQSIDADGTYIEIPYYLGKYVNPNFEFGRACTFANYIGIDLEAIVRKNILKSSHLDL